MHTFNVVPSSAGAGRPTLASSSTLSRPYWNLSNHLNMFKCARQASLYAIFIILCLSAPFIPNFKQNLSAVRCSWCVSITVQYNSTLQNTLYNTPWLTYPRFHEKTFYVSNFALSFYCMNGSKEGRCTNYKYSSVCNSDFIATIVLLEFFKVICLPSIDPFMQLSEKRLIWHIRGFFVISTIHWCSSACLLGRLPSTSLHW